MIKWEHVIGFDWDDGNARKSAEKHDVSQAEAEERHFWETHDSSEYLDWNKAKTAFFPHLKPSTKTISLRLPEALLERIKKASLKEHCDCTCSSYHWNASARSASASSLTISAFFMILTSHEVVP